MIPAFLVVVALAWVLSALRRKRPHAPCDRLAQERLRVRRLWREGI